MVKIEHVTKLFNKNLNPEDLRVALDDVTLEIEDGEFVTVIGGNGSGKSTLLNVITGNHLVDHGKISIDGVDVTNMSEHIRAKYIGIVFQDPMQGTAANMSIIENLSIAHMRDKRKTLKWGFKKQNISLYQEKLATLNLGLEHRLTQKIGLLSGGQRQAVTLLMASLESPKVLLLDEHTAALDPKTAKIVLELTDKIVRENKLTTLMITHNMKDAIKYGNRLLMLHNGKIIFDVKGEEKKNLTIEQLLKKFDQNSEDGISDSLLLSV